MPAFASLEDFPLPIAAVEKEEVEADAAACWQMVMPIFGGQKTSWFSRLEDASRQARCSRRQLRRKMYALAHHTLKAQSDVFRDVVDYVRLQIFGQRARGLVFVHYTRYDETQLVLRGRGLDQQTYEERYHIWVVEQDWSFLLEELSDEDSRPNRLLLLCGGSSPKVRSSGNTKAETLVTVLEGTSLVSLELYKELASLCGQTVRLIETDSCGSNLRAEKILLSSQPEGEETYTKLHVTCMAHRVHGVASKTWQLSLSAQAALIHTLKILKANGALQRFVRTLIEVILENLRVTTSGLSDAALHWRAEVTKLFAPKASEKTRPHLVVRFVSTFILNGDWTKADVEHRCMDCCQSLRHLEDKVRLWVPRLISALGVRILNRSDWKSWKKGTYLVGMVSGMHGLFPPRVLACVYKDLG